MSHSSDDWPKSRSRLPDRESRTEITPEREVPKLAVSTHRPAQANERSASPPARAIEEAPIQLPIKRRPAWQLWVLGITLSGVAAVALGALGVVLVVDHYSTDLPDVRRLQNNYAPPQMTRIYARDGSILSTIFSERRTVVPVARVPDHVKAAFLAAEDARFFEHEGLNYFGMLRAMAINLRAGEVRQGGSTITQQVVKNVLLDNARSYKRKIRETILAYRLEKTLTKEQILGMYLNHIYLGHGRYGVEEAGRYYFGKHVEELNIAEAALLAGIVAAPEHFSPRKDETKALARRAYVLNQMRDKGFMTDAVYGAASKMPVRLAPLAEGESDIAPEMVLKAQHELKLLLGDQAKLGGYSVHTTLDPALQVAARSAVQHGLDDYLTRQKLKAPFTLEQRKLWGKPFQGHPHRYGIYTGTVVDRNDRDGTLRVRVGDVEGLVHLHEERRFNPTHIAPTDFASVGAALRVQLVDPPTTSKDAPLPRLRLELGPQAALLAVDPSTRQVVAAVGSYEALPGGLDRSFQAKRQPGSTFKPIVYSLALSRHQVTPASIFTFPAKNPQPAAPGQEGPLMDRLTLRQGIASSDNRVAQDVFERVGGQAAVDWAKKMGIGSKLGPTPSLMLGAYEVSVAEMAAAYCVLANGGTYQALEYVSRVESGTGELPRKGRAEPTLVMDPGVAYVMTDLLTSVVQSGTATAARSLERPLAGKTGTTNHEKDAWFVGYSTDLVVAVWVGFDDAIPLGWGESGARAALPIWIEFMKTALADKPSTEFARPADVISVELDPDTGLLARYGQANSVAEIFLRGTEPSETAPLPSPAVPPDEAPVPPNEPAAAQPSLDPSAKAATTDGPEPLDSPASTSDDP